VDYTVVGKSVTPVDAKEKALGTAEYVTDMRLPGMLYGKILRSPYAHARILGIDTSEAEQIPGVKAVITFKDTPQIPFGTQSGGPDDWYILAKDKVRFVGDEVAAVAALDEETAEKALRLIHVKYEELPCVLTPEESVKENSPRLYDERPDNVAFSYKVERGDVEKAFAESDVVIQDVFYTSQVYQSYLETMAAVAKWDANGRVTMWLPTQVPMKSRIVYAKALGVSAGKVQIIKPFMGGGFGAKFEYVAHVICAELARKTGRPVKIVNSRTEDFMAGNPRVPMKIEVKMGAKRDGTLLGKQVKILSGNGARTVYGPPITSTACYRVDSLYKFTNVKAEGILLYTNTVPTGCFRGFGNTQMVTALELMMDRIAEALKMDPAELRLKNCVPDGYLSCHGWKVNTCGLPECLSKAVGMSGWKDKYGKHKSESSKSKGIGLACCNHVSGNRPFFKPFDGSSSLIRIGEEGQVTLIHPECDMGQGQNTAFAQIAAEVLGVPYETMVVKHVDTDIAALGLGSFATRGTTIGGQGVIAAARDAKAKILESASELSKVKEDELDINNGVIYEKASGREVMTVAEAARNYIFTHGGMPVTGNGYWIPDTVLPDETKYGNVSPVYPFATHIAEVEVDLETGVVDVVDYWAVHDVGKVINPLLLEGQVHGGVSTGIGWALTEDMLYDEKGNLLNPGFLDYRIPGPKDTPRIHTDFVETDDPCGPLGAKGIGEPAINPVAAAILNAIYDAIGVRFNSLPVTPERILDAISRK
jgi:CO/xanthine dehydrogenase Mo-binding subunit